jgi:hypothetical protein
VNTKTIALASIVILAVAGTYFAISLASTNQNTQSELQNKQIRIKLTELTEDTETWIPSTIYLKKGQTYELTIINGDGEDEHKFIIPELGVETKDISAANGQEKILLTPMTEGTFSFTDPSVPDWTSLECSDVSGFVEQTCVKPGQIIVEP